MGSSSKKKKILVLFILCSFLLISTNLSDLVLSVVQEEDNTIDEGDNLYQNIPYTFSRTFYNDSNLEQGYSTAYLQTQYIPNINVEANDSITTYFDHTEFQYPANESIATITGNHYQNGTLDSLDDDYAIFNSSYDVVIPEQPSNFTLVNGTSAFDGDLEFIDSNYTTFDSSSIGNYPATYDFENQMVGDTGLEIEWVTDLIDTYDAPYIENSGGFYNRTIRYQDIGADAVGSEMDFTTAQTSGTVEFWFKISHTNKYAYFIFREATVGVISLRWDDAGTFSDGIGGFSWSYDTNWNHYRIDFECGIGGYKGLSADTYDIYINNILKGDDCPFGGVATAIDDLWSRSNKAAHQNYNYWFDAVGYSWDSEYDVGDNLLPNPSLLTFIVDLNLNPFSTLNDLSLIYSFRTNFSLLCNFSIYNFDSTSYESILSSINLTFQHNCYFPLNSSYYNATNDMILKFEMKNSTNKFQFDVDKLTVMKPSILNFTTYTTFDRINELLQLNITSHQRSNILQNVSFSVWDWTNGEWDAIGTTNYYSTFQVSGYSSSIYLDYISNNKQVLVNYYAVNYTSKFNFEVDKLEINYFNKTGLSIQKSFSLLGVWRYRFNLDIGLGIEYITSWTYFNVILLEPNFYAISESDLTTRWILQDNELTPVVNFTDDINTNYWNLVDVSNIYFNYFTTITGDAFVMSSSPDENRGYDYETVIDYVSSQYIRSYYYFSGINSNYLFLNESENYKIALYNHELLNTVHDSAQMYNTSSFSEGTITWNNAPSPETLQNSFDLQSTGWNYWNITDLNGYYALKWATESGTTHYAWFRSKEYGSNKPYFIREDVSKNYFGSGYMYMQTNTTESIALKSVDYGTHKTLSSGDYFEVDFQTNSDSQINLILLKNGVVNKTLTLSQSGNTNFNRHTVKISASELLEFDQLKISSTFEDKDNVKVYDIKTYKYTVVGDYADFYVGSRRDYEVYLTPDTYNLRIEDYNTGFNLKNVNITIPATGIYQYVYTPIQTQYCRIALFNTEGVSLTFTDYHIYVNRSLNGEYNRFALLENIFSADEKTYVYIEVYDRFNSLIYSDKELASDYIDLEIEVYELKIKNLMIEKTILDINSSWTFPLLSEEIIYFMLSKSYYQIGYYDTNDVYKQFLIYLDTNQAYELNRSRIVFLSYTDQRGNHLFFEDYKTYVNGSLLYENIFYREIGDHVGIEIKDRYDISIKNETYIVVSDDNYVPIILTMYSLKLKNMQEVFNHVNITRDPNYYESPYSWSEWIAPAEIISFRLFAGYYKINITDNEHSTYSYYAYTLNGDDVLLISSNNTLAQIVYNIANVNTTIGNQITNVQIDLTNQNTAINNSIINVEINLSNVNSSLGNILVNLQVDIENVANNISSLYMFTNTSFINIGNNINNSFIYLENNIYSINQSISNLVIGISNDLWLINGSIHTAIIDIASNLELVNNSISGLIVDIENNLLIINSSIHQAVFDLDTNLMLVNTSIHSFLNLISTDISIVNSNLTNYYSLINNSIYLTNNNINDTRLAILNNLVLVNNSMSDLISQVYTSVYLINNSIYTAVVDLGTSLSLINNSISGDLTIILQMNDFLTELYQTTMFSDLLNWTLIGYNTSMIESQIDVWEFINNYNDYAGTVFLRYQGLIDNLTISAQNTLDQYLPKEDVEYRIWSEKEQDYLDEWQPLPPNKTVNFGYYEEVIPEIPDFNVGNSFLMIVLIVVGFIIILIIPSYFVNKYYKRAEGYRKAYIRKTELDTKTVSRFSSGTRIK